MITDGWRLNPIIRFHVHQVHSTTHLTGNSLQNLQPCIRQPPAYNKSSTQTMQHHEDPAKTPQSQPLSPALPAPCGASHDRPKTNSPGPDSHGWEAQGNTRRRSCRCRRSHLPRLHRGGEPLTYQETSPTLAF